MNADRPAHGIFLAPAKVNLALRVVGKRADGYHLLQSILVFFPLYDQLEIEVLRDEDGLELVCEPVVTASPEENLVMRAARALLNATGVQRGARLRLLKRIPDGAGLGGGSSDAALVLLALNRLWGLHLDLQQLMALGVGLGADIPFFLGGRSALVQGIGEQLTPIPVHPSADLVLVHPGVALSTRRVFHAWAGKFLDRREPLAMPGPAVTDLVTLLENDLESPAMALAPVIGEVLYALKKAGALGVRMSGSGSSVFGVFPDTATAASAAQRLSVEQKGWRVFSGRIFHTHPFFD
ncbi:MAG: 4-(cytidine 5'-diphospho)-2-C-methyl-D-erythritol kinase [Magnetococcales bacterium]|nr:4-(cytidine 5'-diphospho)-2-C-methyl-D-erythritol kinase [Magnetococcales bacterium]